MPPLHARRGGKEDSRMLKLTIAKAITGLKTAEYRIMHHEARLQEKIRQLNKKLVTAKQRGENLQAQLLAQEIAERMKILHHIRSFRLSLERLRTRLETIRLLGDARPLLKGIEPMIAEIRSSTATTLPEIGLVYAQLEERLAELDAGLSTSLPNQTLNPAEWTASDEEVARILREAEEIARAREREQMPPPPG